MQERSKIISIFIIKEYVVILNIVQSKFVKTVKYRMIFKRGFMYIQYTQRIKCFLFDRSSGEGICVDLQTWREIKPSWQKLLVVLGQTVHSAESKARDDAKVGQDCQRILFIDGAALFLT